MSGCVGSPKGDRYFTLKRRISPGFPGFRRQGLDRAAICITIRIPSHSILEGAESPRLKQIYETFGLLEKPTTPEGFVALYRDEGPVIIAIARELGVSLD